MGLFDKIPTDKQPAWVKIEVAKEKRAAQAAKDAKNPPSTAEKLSRQKAALEQERIAHERERIAFDRQRMRDQQQQKPGVHNPFPPKPFGL